MSISYLLVFLGLGIFAVSIAAMFWAIDSGQYDDAEAQGRSIFDDEAPATPPEPQRRTNT